MTHIKSIGQVVIALLVVSGMVVPAAALTDSGASASDDAGPTAAVVDTPEDSTENSSGVNVTAGQQLSTVIDVSSDEVQTDVENTGFEVSVEGADEETQAEAIAERSEELRERAEDIHEDYEEATEAYEAGEISKSEYAQRLATLNARASNLLDSYERLQGRSENVSALELRAAGVNQSAQEETVENLSRVNGAGHAALLKRFTGESQGKIEIETADGVTIETESENGERSREIERPRDDDRSITVNQSAALETARAALSTPDNGAWTLTEAKVKQDDGAYEFEFVLRDAADRTGEAEIEVDGSSGEIFDLEEETEAHDGEDREDEREEEEDREDAREDDEREDEDGELAVLVADGTPEPGATVTLRVLGDGEPAQDATVYLNDRLIGSTDANGAITVTLPESGEAELTAEKGETEGELEFEFEEADDEADEAFEKMNVDTTLDDETVTVTVTYDGSSVANATVYANDRAVGTTASDGTVAFTIDADSTDELELEVVKGEFAAELAYEIQAGTPIKTEEEHEGDGEETEDEESEDDDERADEEEGEEEGERDDEEDGEETDDDGEEAGEEDGDGDDREEEDEEEA